MNGFGGKRTPHRSAEKLAKMGCHWAHRGGKEIDGWGQVGELTADGSSQEGAKIRGVATQWAPDGNG